MLVYQELDVSWDFKTSEPGCLSFSSRSHRDLRRPSSPSFLRRLRSLSSRRASSARGRKSQHPSRAFSDLPSVNSASLASPCREYLETRLPSYESERSSGSVIVGGVYKRDSSVALNSYQASHSSMTMYNSEDAVIDPYLLVPNISITPEVRTLGDGESKLWVAIEISGQLFRPSVSRDCYGTDGAGNLFMPVYHGDGLARYGYLYDTKVEILPMGQSSVVDVIDDDKSRYIEETAR